MFEIKIHFNLNFNNLYFHNILISELKINFQILSDIKLFEFLI
jgi:hypothetical protein